MAPHKLRFHADQIGSLIHSSALSRLQDQADAGTITSSQLRDGQRAAIAAIVDKYFSGFFEALAGFHEASPVPRDLARSSALSKVGQPYMMAAVCHDMIRYETSSYLENWKLLRDSVDPALWPDCKFTVPPPCYFHLRLAPGKSYDASVYANDAELFADLAVAYRKEIRTLYDTGLRNL
ncbi:hypothetical protein E4U58_000457 [Claviceps cyperi]|nr:hypothetical protein E4U58_000457 [Claviceps cyperi]